MNIRFSHYEGSTSRASWGAYSPFKWDLFRSELWGRGEPRQLRFIPPNRSPQVPVRRGCREVSQPTAGHSPRATAAS